MTQVIVADLVTGKRIISVPHTTLSWTKARNTADSITCTIPMTSRAVRRLDLYNATTPAKTMMAVLENDVVVALGEIWSRRWSENGKTLQIAASGLQTHLSHRTVLPVLTDSQNVLDSTGASASWSGTDFINLTYGAMVRRLLLQMMAWPGGALPLVFQTEETGGTYEKHYLGANLTKMDAAIDAFTKLQNGIDIDFFGRRSTTDPLALEVLVRTGTVAAPELHGPTIHRFDMSVPRPSMRNLVISDDASTMTGQAWTSGGRQDGTAVIQRALNHSLTDVGYPLLESVDSSHSDASEVDTLQTYAGNAIALGSAPSSTWTFDIRGDVNPRPGFIWPGDFCDVVIPRDHPYVPKWGPHRREIASISGDQDGRWFNIATEESIDA